MVFLFFLGFDENRVEINLPSIEVQYENLDIQAEVCVGTRALPSFTNFITNIVEVSIGTNFVYNRTCYSIGGFNLIIWFHCFLVKGCVELTSSTS